MQFIKLEVQFSIFIVVRKDNVILVLESANRNEFQLASPYSKEYRFDALLRMLVRFLKTGNFGRFEDSLLLMLIRFVQEHAVQRTFRRDDLEVMWVSGKIRFKS